MLAVKRPMAVIGITYLVSQIIAIAAGTAMSAVFCATAIALAALSFILLSDRHRRIILPVLVSCAVAFGAYSIYCFAKVEPAQRLYGQTAYVCGEIVEEPYTSNGRSYYVIDADYIEGIERITNTRIRVSAQTPLEADVSDIFEGTVVINIQENNEAFSASSSRIARGILLTAYIPYGNEPNVTEGRHGMNYYICQARRAVRGKIALLFDGDISSLLKGVLLGDTSSMSSELISDFRTCGLSHILAVSGLHMTMIVYVLTILLRHLGVSYRPLSAILLAFVWAFIALTGFSYSVLRAGIMTSMMLMARVLNREADSLNSFGTALLVICIINPYAASDAGLLLSASSSFGLITINSKVMRRVNSFVKQKVNDPSGILNGIISSVVASITATTCAAPILMLYFGEYSLISPLANLLCVQLSNIFMISGAIAIVLSFIPFIGGVLARVVGVLTWIAGKLLVLITGVLGDMPNSSVLVNYDFLPIFFICAALILAVWFVMSRGRENRFGSFCICAAVIAQVFIVGLAAEHISRIDDRYVTVYNVEDGLAVTAVSGYDCVVIGTGGDRYSAWQMTLDMQSQNLADVDAIFYPSSSDVYTSYADGFIEDMTPEYIFMPDSCDNSDDLTYAVRNVNDRLYDVADAYYSNRNGSLQVETYTDSSGDIWVNVVNGDMRVLICPENGNCSLIPEEMRYPWCAVVLSSDITNIGALSPSAVIVSADSEECAHSAALLRYRGVEMVYTTAQGNVIVSENGAGMLIGGD